jgi:urea transport system permease protein
MTNLVLPWNRIAIIVFAAAVVTLVSLLLNRTRLGLFVRGVTQNRPMASALGVSTNRVDMYAFGLGSGIAGLAGCALSQIGNVGPDLGQSYIVDSFMVVVLGGVGQLAGTVYAAIGLGIVNKLLEAWSGAVLAKIALLVFIIVFIQKRPQGMFALKGRAVETCARVTPAVPQGQSAGAQSSPGCTGRKDGSRSSPPARSCSWSSRS